MSSKFYITLLLMTIVTYLIRVLPITLIRKEIKNKYIRSFLYYVPTQSWISGTLALIAAIIVAWKKPNLFITAAISCIVVFITELFI